MNFVATHLYIKIAKMKEKALYNTCSNLEIQCKVLNKKPNVQASVATDVDQRGLSATKKLGAHCLILSLAN